MRCTNKRRALRVVDGNEFRYEHPCGQCMACRITRRQEWTARMLLEFLNTPASYFITLTYNQRMLPDFGVKTGHLYMPDLQRFWKRLRKASPDVQFRYFACGEYGDARKRPHYHALVFCSKELPLELDNRLKVTGSPFHRAWLPDCIVDVAPLLASSDGIRVARYVAGYVVKKMTGKKVLEVIGNVRPEFSVSSRNPGIGLRQAEALAAAMVRSGFARDGAAVECVPGSTHDFHMIRIGGKLWPIDRVLKSKIMDAIGEDTRSDFVKAHDADAKIMWRALSMDIDAELDRDREAYYKSVKSERRHDESKARGLEADEEAVRRGAAALS